MKYVLMLSLAGLVVLGLWGAGVSAQQSGVTAEPFNLANLRQTTDVNSEKVGEITAGTVYPVLGRSEFFPWYLLGDPASMQPIGWVFADLVTVQGNVNSVPLSDFVMGSGGPTNALQATATLPAAVADAAPAMMTPGSPAAAPQTVDFAVTGMVLGEVNVRYGPGVDYPRVGVARAGDRFGVTGYHTQFPWLQIAYPDSPNQRAWIAQDLLEVTGNVFSLPAVSDGTLNLPPLTPTPSVVGSSVLGEGEAVPLSPAFAALGNQLWSRVLGGGFDPETSRFGGLFLMDLQTGEAITFGNDIAFSGTSINKVSILARLYETLDAPPGELLSVDIANTMICSENAATNRLLGVIGEGDDFLGAERVSFFLRELGLMRTFLTSPYIVDPTNPPVPPRPLAVPQTTADQTKANPDLSNQMTVEDMGWLLADIYECGYNESGPLIDGFEGRFEPRECRQMLHVMSNNNVDALLRAGVPEGVRVAHKHGWIADTHGNAGVFFTPGGDYVMVMMLHQPSWLFYNESLPVIADSSRIVYNYYNPDAPLNEVREGFIPDAPTCNFAGTPLITDLRQPIWNQ